MNDLITLPLPGTLGSDKGAGANGVLIGKLTATNVSKFLLQNAALTDGKCITDDGGVFVNESTPFNEATASDVEIPLTAVDDATYFGHLTAKPSALHLQVGVQGVAGASPAVIAWEYSQGGGLWGTLADVVDGTTAFTATVSATPKVVSFTAPEDFEKDSVDGVYGYWVRARHASGDAHATTCELTRGYIITATAEGSFTDDTTDFNDADANDVALLPAYPVVGDAGYVGHATEKFPVVLFTTGTAGVHTLTLTWEYWNGTAWTTLTVIDDTVKFTATAGALLVHFAPPTDWVANTAGNGPNGNAGFFIRYRVSAFTSITTQPLLTSGRVFPLTTGADGLIVRTPDSRGQIVFGSIDMSAMVASGSTADSKFLLYNLTSGLYETITWTKAVGLVRATPALGFAQGDKLALIQIQEDGTTEFAGAFWDAWTT